LRPIRRAAAAALVLLAAVAGTVWLTLPNVASLRRRTPATTSFIEIRKARLRAAGRSDRVERIVVPLSRISPSLQRAVIVAEDANFYSHHGVDWVALKAAAETDLEKKRWKLGGSTITQQLAKNLYLTPARTPWRKLRELAIAWKLEAELPKRRILELYLNSIEWGERIYGAEAAARHYFGRPASDLTLRESAQLAAMIPAPRRFDPRHPSRRLERRTARILLAMERR
jgi:monofunctional biosynthetic peptidoglycan transglycosylase